MQICPKCGHSEIPLPTSVTFTAGEYKHEKTGKVCTIASNEDKIEAKDGVWIKSSLWKAPVASVPKPVEVKK